MIPKIQKDLQYRKEVLAPKIATEYKAAIDDGDGAHDNPGIRDKGQEMEDNLMEIQRLENLLREMTNTEQNKEKVGISEGSEVEIQLIDEKNVRTLKLVTSDSVQYTDNAVSVDSPLGQALIGKSVNDEVELLLPSGMIKRYKILNVK